MPVTPSKTYFFRVKAFNVAGRGVLSSESSGMIAASVSSEPFDLRMVSQSEFQIKFEWTQPEDLGGIPLTQYRIYWDYGVLGTQLTELFVEAGVKLPSEEFYTQSSDLTSGVTY